MKVGQFLCVRNQLDDHRQRIVIMGSMTWWKLAMSVNSQGSVLGVILNDKDSVIESTLSKFDTKKVAIQKDLDKHTKWN